MINVPTTSKLPSPGEIVASVELMTAHVSDLSRKIDRIESRVNDWVNLQLAERMTIAERGIDALKTSHNVLDERITCISQHYLTEKDGADLYERIRDLVDQNEDTNKCLDRFSVILTIHTKKLRHAKHRSRNLAKKCAEIGILRRRVSKVEENNTENAQCFETTTELRGLLDDMRAQLRDYKDKCDYLESMNACACMRFGCGNPHIEDLYRDLPSLEPIMCDENMELCEGTDLNAYFSNYWDNTNTEDKQEEKQKGNNTPKEIVINIDEEFAKYGDVSNDDGDDDDDDDDDEHENDDDFEKL
jgi:transposase-like protein